jgi:hypothetical protein
LLVYEYADSLLILRSSLNTANMTQSERENESGPQPIQAADGRRERLRFSEFTFERTPDGRCRVEVVLDWLDGVRVRGQATGQSSPTVDIRVSAEAAIKAIETFSNGEMSFELIGAKAIRAFDANVVIVSITNKREGPRRLLGASLVEDDVPRGAVLAVLGATNRVLGNFIATR